MEELKANGSSATFSVGLLAIVYRTRQYNGIRGPDAGCQISLAFFFASVFALLYTFPGSHLSDTFQHERKLTKQNGQVGIARIVYRTVSFTDIWYGIEKWWQIAVDPDAVAGSRVGS